MNISFGNGQTEHGPGVQIDLTGEDVATAIYAFLMAHGVFTNGPATITVNGKRIEYGSMYVDPSGRVISKDYAWNGKGYME